ncbi:MAG: hypothetical protein JST59_11445 [Actinobacteria bacterium]|nr:hypothetical protein [Actinomycetota bacterium]
MPDQSTRADEITADYHDRIQALVIVRIVSEQPYNFTIPELVRYFSEGEEGQWISQPSDIESAVADLVADGLLHRAGKTVRPTRPIVRYERLDRL